MKRIGIIGGMSYESTFHYYERINRQVNERAGGLTSADMVLRSVNFEKYHELMEKGDWVTIGRRLRAAARNLFLENQCNYVAIATNTMHKVAEYIAEPYTWMVQRGRGQEGASSRHQIHYDRRFHGETPCATWYRGDVGR